MGKIYQHSYFKGMSYYAARGLLMKEGFKVIAFNDWRKNNNKFCIMFSDGWSRVKMLTEVLKNPNTNNLYFGKILAIEEYCDD